MARGTADTSLVKQGYSKTAYTPDSLEDFKNCADTDTGPLYFMSNHVKIQHPTKGGMDFDPFSYQLDLIENYNNFRYSINMLGRQMGKTTVAAGYLLWYAMFKPDSTILVAAHKQAGASEIMQRIRYAYESVPNHIRAGVTEYNKGSMTMDNGSRIISATTTENTGRGMSLSLVYLDEFAFVPPRIAKEFWTSLSPTLATGGKCIITSTPNSDDDTFAMIWNQANKMFDEHGNEQEVGVNGFKPMIAKWEEHPDRDAAWATEERGRIGEERFRREHECEFVIYDETLINALKLVDMKGVDPIRTMGQVRWYKHPHPTCTYVVSLDPATGTGGDAAGIQVLELPTMVQVAEWQHNLTPIEGQMKVMMEIMQYLQELQVAQIYWSVENNGIGEACLLVIQDFGEEHIPGLFVSEPMRKGHVRKFRKGFNTTHSTKVSACSRLKTMVENSKMVVNSKPLISELKSFVATGSSYRAKSGGTDDLISATLLAIRMMAVLKDWDPRVYNTFNQTEQLDEYEPPMPIFITRNY